MRFVKIAGKMGPRTMHHFLKMVEKLNGSKPTLAPDDKTAISEEAIATAVGVGGNLILFSSNPNPQCLSPVTSFCHRYGLECWSGDSERQKPSEAGGKEPLELVSEDPEGVIESAMIHQPKRKPGQNLLAILQDPSSFSTANSYELQKIIDTARSAQANLEKVVENYLQTVLSLKKHLVPADGLELVALARKLAAKNGHKSSTQK